MLVMRRGGYYGNSAMTDMEVGARDDGKQTASMCGH
jgi:hypothetical protein